MATVRCHDNSLASRAHSLVGRTEHCIGVGKIQQKSWVIPPRSLRGSELTNCLLWLLELEQQVSAKGQGLDGLLIPKAC